MSLSVWAMYLVRWLSSWTWSILPYRHQSVMSLEGTWGHDPRDDSIGVLMICRVLAPPRPDEGARRRPRKKENQFPHFPAQIVHPRQEFARTWSSNFAHLLVPRPRRTTPPPTHYIPDGGYMNPSPLIINHRQWTFLLNVMSLMVPRSPAQRPAVDRPWGGQSVVVSNEWCSFVDGGGGVAVVAVYVTAWAMTEPRPKVYQGLVLGVLSASSGAPSGRAGRLQWIVLGTCSERRSRFQSIRTSRGWWRNKKFL